MSEARPRFRYRRPVELDRTEIRRVPIVIVGAGPVGLTAAAELAVLGHESVLLDEDDTVSVGSRAICWAKRTLEIFDRIGAGDRMVAKGVVWNRGRLFHRDREVYGFDLLPEPGHRRPAFINLQQYYVEEYLVDRVVALGRTDLRWRNRVTGIEVLPGGGARLTVETPDGSYRLDADHVLAADGVRSPIRRMMGLDFKGKVFEDRFLIADVVMKADFPSERWFWFEPPFHTGQSVLLHRQPDDVYRIDFQLDPSADPDEERKPANVIPRLQQMLGPDAEFDLEWVSVYTFTCRRMDRFRHGPVFFVGDSAHVVSPFGARGGNGGIQDVDTLCWKLAAVLDGTAPATLLDSYDAERVPAADENLLNSTRSTDFMTPKTEASIAFREAALDMAADLPFARRIVNSGRLSLPHRYAATPLSTPDCDAWPGGPPPGAPAIDAPVRVADGEPWLLRRLGGGFTLLRFEADAGAATIGLPAGIATLTVMRRGEPGADTVVDPDGTAFRRWAAEPGAAYLIRPDQHVAARWMAPQASAVRAAHARALGCAPGADELRAAGG
ncbi:FAD-dependent oxidoreductase [Thalassobaculum sp.]|uniref:FAD-dependent oxidoreductase n=1 Tax=Thalassobaculum sp. TaxID=2022740 RepID=UPI0032EB4F9C